MFSIIAAIQVICYVFAGYFVLNTIMCFFSNSKKEKLLAPVAFLAAICFGITAFQM